MWVFGYGSLMWDDEWAIRCGCIRCEKAVLEGFRRDFSKASVKNWGTEKNPCPTLDLFQESGATCVGLAFEFSDETRQHIVDYLKEREGKSFSLDEKGITLESGNKVKALVPINNHSSKTYIGNEPMAKRAQSVKAAQGKSGSCVDYVKNIRTKLRELEIEDQNVEEFFAEVVK